MIASSPKFSIPMHLVVKNELNVTWVPGHDSAQVVKWRIYGCQLWRDPYVRVCTSVGNIWPHDRLEFPACFIEAIC